MRPDQRFNRYVHRVPPDKSGGGTPSRKAAESPESTTVDDDDRFLLCIQCRQIITHPSECIEVAGAHRHTFANPHGIVYEIGCFRNAAGCGHAGQATDEFTWFSGYHWRVAICSRCLSHLGWRFTSGGGQGFYGLILDRLVESES